MATVAQNICKKGHKMAGFDQHGWCHACRDKSVGEDLCVIDQTDCEFCAMLTPEQLEQLNRSPYLESDRKDFKRGRRGWSCA